FCPGLARGLRPADTQQFGGWQVSWQRDRKRKCDKNVAREFILEERCLQYQYLSSKNSASKNETVAEPPGLVWLLKGMCRIVLASTCEHGGHRYVRSRGVSTRSHRRDDRDGKLATARGRPCQSHLHAPSVSTLWLPGLSGQAIPADAARLGQSR